jgi:exodeoxyribonuclease V alpha subunit
MAESLFLTNPDSATFPGPLLADHHLLAVALAWGIRDHYHPRQAFAAIPAQHHDAAMLCALILLSHDQGHGCLPLIAFPAWWENLLATQANTPESSYQNFPYQEYQTTISSIALRTFVAELPKVLPDLWTTDPGNPQPFLLLDKPDFCLYSQRQYYNETRVAELLSLRLGLRHQLPLACPDLSIPAPAGASPQVQIASAKQSEAIIASLGHAFFVLSGGPGTGKTTTVFHLLHAWYQSGVRRIGLGAPTGRAAQRMKDSLMATCQAQNAGSLAPGFAYCIQQLEPATVHRWAGRGSLNGLELRDLELLIIDEASMLDSELASVILEGLDPLASLILVGDHRQLPAVEDGSIMADIAQFALSQQSRPWFWHLEHSLRAGDQVLRIPRMIAKDEPANTIFPAFSGVANLLPHGLKALATEQACRWCSCHEDNRHNMALRQSLIEFVCGIFSPNASSDCLSNSIVLSARREGFWGAETMNILIAEQYRCQWRKNSEPSLWFHGQEIIAGMPLMIRRNDLSLGVFNGDRGIVRCQQNNLVIELLGGRSLPLAILPEFSVAFAMTIHKSQGSEFDHVTILTDHHNATATRELLYTGLTRARKSWTLYASPQGLAAILNRATHRFSQLAYRLTTASP